MFKREMWFMWAMTVGMIVLGFVAALIVPSYIGRTRIKACERGGGTWNAEQHACVARR